MLAANTAQDATDRDVAANLHKPASTDIRQPTIRAEREPITRPVVVVITPGNYTAILRGVNNTTGIAVVEVYALD